MGQSESKDELNDANLYEAEMKVLLLSGMPADQLRPKNVLVGTFDGQPVYIRTVICGDESKPKLVFVHGYAGSGALFFKIIKQMCKYFCLIFVDVIGMGASSRPSDYDAEKFTAEQSIAYFNDYMERWRVAMDDMRDFYLVGHSFGGYLVGNYAAQYPQYIKKLMLLSPIGVKPVPPPGEEKDW